MAWLLSRIKGVFEAVLAMMELAQSSQDGFIRVKGYSRTSRKKLNCWYERCCQNNHFYLAIVDKQKYCNLTTDTWTTPFNFSRLGEQRVRKLIAAYSQPEWRLARKGWWACGSVGPSIFGLPIEDAEGLTNEILSTWAENDNRTRVSGPALCSRTA